ncbi:MAG: hypothetical protein AB1505_24995 [Candidatus Latescibacterota bacterium]
MSRGKRVPAGGMVLLGLLGRLLGRRMRRAAGARRVVITDRYATSLAALVAWHQSHGRGLAEALALVLRERAPILLVAPRHRPAWGRALGIAALIGAGAYVGLRLTAGSSPLSRVRGRMPGRRPARPVVVPNGGPTTPASRPPAAE